MHSLFPWVPLKIRMSHIELEMQFSPEPQGSAVLANNLSSDNFCHPGIFTNKTGAPYGETDEL